MPFPLFAGLKGSAKVTGKRIGTREVGMPIYEYRCLDCGKKFEVLHLSAEEVHSPECKHCQGRKVRKLISRVRVVRSEESRLESLMDPSMMGGLDEKDPKSLAKWMKRMGKEMGEDVSDEEIEQVIEDGASETGTGESEE
jgi:putative FmdB family regulatory protein